MIKIGYGSHRGLKRENNEDAYLVLPEKQVFLVADGVGGNNSGEIASGLAVKFIREFLEQRWDSFAEKGNGADRREEDAVHDLFLQCLSETNRQLFSSAREREENAGMATTAVVCCVRGGTAYFYNVGDSRAYLFRGGVLRQITEDHSLINKLVREGKLSREQGRQHPDRNVITRALGAEPVLRADPFLLPLEKGDKVILCTDGLHGELEDREIEEIMKGLSRKRKSPAGAPAGGGELFPAVEALTEAANRKGGRDNITVIYLEFEGEA